MLEIIIPEIEIYDQKDGHFYTVERTILQLEHSLISLSKWEGTHHKYLLGNVDLTNEELLDYIKCMTCNTDAVNPLVYSCISKDSMQKIEKYMKDPMTATWFSNTNNSQDPSRQKITSELLYSYMIDLGIWKECEYWHLNKLLTLIKVRIEETKPKQQGNIASAISHFRDLKAKRRANKHKAPIPHIK